jgi:hypothetical protein
VSALFEPAYRRTTVVTTAMMALSLAAFFGVMQHLPRIVPGLPDVRGLTPVQIEQTVSAVHFFEDLGQFAGRLLFVLLVVRATKQRQRLRGLLVPGLVVFPLALAVCPQLGLRWLEAGVFLATTLMVAQFSFWWNYLPCVYPTHLRGTGEGFAANVGGRMIASFAAVLTTWLSASMPGDDVFARLAYAAAAMGFLVHAGGLLFSSWLPEPEGSWLPE